MSDDLRAQSDALLAWLKRKLVRTVLPDGKVIYVTPAVAGKV